MFGKKKEKRFVLLEHESVELGLEYMILVDKQTGVNYLMTAGMGLSGMSPLLNANGDVVVSSLPLRVANEEMDM